MKNKSLIYFKLNTELLNTCFIHNTVLNVNTAGKRKIKSEAISQCITVYEDVFNRSLYQNLLGLSLALK